MTYLKQAVVGGCAVAALVAAPVVSLPGAAPTPVAASLAYTALASAAIDKPANAAPGTDTREITPDDEFAAVGVVWDEGATTGKIEVRVQREDGSWEPWVELEPTQDGPTPGTTEASISRPGTMPVHVEEGKRVQVRVPETDSEVLDDASVVTVDPGTSAADGNTSPTPLSDADAATPMPRILTRKEWGANESYRNCNPFYSDTVEAVTLHHTAGSNSYSKANAAARVRADYAYHTNALGWCDIGYNAIVDKYGTIYEGRAGGLTRPVQGAHAAGFNNNTWGIAMLGNNASRTPSSAQQESIAQLMAWKLSSYNRDPKTNVTLISQGMGGTNNKYPRGTKVVRPRIFAHRDVGQTSCPGAVGYGTLPGIRSRVAELAAGKIESNIMKEWERLGGESGYFGKIVTGERSAPGGRFARFERGGIYETSNGMRTTIGGIHDRYFAYDGPLGGLGMPKTDEYDVPNTTGGRAQNFVGAYGAVYWSPKTPALAVYGGIHNEWQATGGAAGPFGFPINEESNIANYVGAGRVQSFQGGDVYWGPRIGSIHVPASLRKGLADAGGPAVFGMPMADPIKTRNGYAQRYEIANSWLYGNDRFGYRMVYGAIRDAYVSEGGPDGALGFPRTPEYGVPGGRAQTFESGVITWNAATGTTSVSR